MVIIIDILSNSPSNLAEKTPKKTWGQDSANDPVGSSDFKSGISPAKVRHGKIHPLFSSVNHLFLWAMASVAMLNNQRVIIIIIVVISYQ